MDGFIKILLEKAVKEGKVHVVHQQPEPKKDAKPDFIAEAKKEAMIREAEGQAQAILAVQQATADGIRFLNEANPNKGVLHLKSLEAFAKAADGQATKIIIPSEIQGVAGLANAITEVVKK